MIEPPMYTSAKGITFIQSFEDCKLTAYQDSGGVWTVGWGATGKDIGPGTVWTQGEADAAFVIKLSGVEKVVNLDVAVPLSQDEFDALVDFVYNVGPTAFARSTLLT